MEPVSNLLERQVGEGQHNLDFINDETVYDFLRTRISYGGSDRSKISWSDAETRCIEAHVPVLMEVLKDQFNK